MDRGNTGSGIINLGEQVGSRVQRELFITTIPFFLWLRTISCDGGVNIDG